MIGWMFRLDQVGQETGLMYERLSFDLIHITAMYEHRTLEWMTLHSFALGESLDFASSAAHCLISLRKILPEGVFGTSLMNTTPPTQRKGNMVSRISTICPRIRFDSTRTSQLLMICQGFFEEVLDLLLSDIGTACFHHVGPRYLARTFVRDTDNCRVRNLGMRYQRILQFCRGHLEPFVFDEFFLSVDNVV